MYMYLIRATVDVNKLACFCGLRVVPVWLKRVGLKNLSDDSYWCGQPLTALQSYHVIVPSDTCSNAAWRKSVQVILAC